MKIMDWSMFFDSLVIQPKQGKFVLKPDAKQLDAFEASAGFRLPLSYREFIGIFGPGTFPCELEIAAPGYPDLHASLSLERANDYYRFAPEDLSKLRISPDHLALLQRLYMFGARRENIWLGWDLSDIRDPVRNEYAIIAVESMTCVANSFQQLIEDVCDVMLAPDPLWLEEELGPQRCYEPAQLPESNN